MLTDKAIKAAINHAIKTQEFRKLTDSHGLYLQLEPFPGGCGCYWRWKYRFAGKEKTYSIGVYPEIGLAQARVGRDTAKVLKKSGVDPTAQRKADRDAQAKQHSKLFGPFVEAHYENVVKPRLKHGDDEWLASLRKHVFPVFQDRPLATITADELLALLLTVTKTAPERAKRIRFRLEEVFDAARLHNLVSANVAFDVRRALHRPRRGEGKHFPSLPYSGIAKCTREIRASEHAAPQVKLAIEFCILAVARPIEVRRMRWSEINWTERTWTVPASQMKMGRQHVIYLGERAMEILEEASLYSDEFCFPSPDDPERMMGENSLLRFLKRLNYLTASVHGFRATFADWAETETSHKPVVIDLAMAHVRKGEVEQAYKRGEHREARRRLAEDWERYCTALPAEAGANVVPFERKAS